MNLHDQIATLTNEKIAGSDFFLVEVRVSPSKIIVTIDHPVSVGISDCAGVSRYLQEKLAETDVFEKHELEVGSPGMEEPLKDLRQYHKRMGRKVSVLTFDGIKRTGLLKAADRESILIDEEKTVKSGSKKTVVHNELRIPFDQIKETRVLFSFDKII